MVGYNALIGTATIGGVVQSVGAITALATAIGFLINTIGQMLQNAPYIKEHKDYMELETKVLDGKKHILHRRSSIRLHLTMYPSNIPEPKHLC